MKKAYVGKQGQILYEGDGEFIAVYPSDFRIVVDDKGRLETEKYNFDREEYVEIIDKETFEKEKTDISIVFVDGLRDYEEMVDFILEDIDEMIRERLDEGEDLEEITESLKEGLLYNACQTFIHSMSNFLNTTKDGAYVWVKEGSGITGYTVFESFADELSADDLLKQSTKEWILEDYIPDRIEEIKEEIERKNKTPKP